MRFWPVIVCLLIPCLAAQEISIELLVQGLNGPTDIQSARDGSNRLFVVEQSGRIRIIRNGQLQNQPFLDIRDRVQSGGERGLLGLAFARASRWRRRSRATQRAAATHCSARRCVRDPGRAGPRTRASGRRLVPPPASAEPASRLARIDALATALDDNDMRALDVHAEMRSALSELSPQVAATLESALERLDFAAAQRACGALRRRLDAR
jgi:hypothetical protein